MDHRRMMKGVAAASAAGIAMLTTVAGAQTFTLSEMMINPPGADQGQEAIEIKGPPSTMLTDYWLVIIEGDGTGAGVVDQRINLSTYSTGTNGLLLIRDAATALNPAPAAATTVVVFDFTPDIENGANTYIIAKFPPASPPPTVGTDLDSDNDGTLNAGALAQATDRDAVSFTDGDLTDGEYADDLGGTALGFPVGVDGTSTFTPQAIYRIYSPNGSPCTWAAGAISGTAPGPYSWNANLNTGFVAAGITDLVAAAPRYGTPNVPAADSDGDGIGNPCDTGPPPPVADLDGDSDVDGLDLAALLGSWGPCKGCPADLDHNGVVNGIDLALLLGAWDPS